MNSYHRLVLQQTRDHWDKLTKWEQEFIKGLEEKGVYAGLTPKQITTMDIVGQKIGCKPIKLPKVFYPNGFNAKSK